MPLQFCEQFIAILAVVNQDQVFVRPHCEPLLIRAVLHNLDPALGVLENKLNVVQVRFLLLLFFFFFCALLLCLFLNLHKPYGYLASVCAHSKVLIFLIPCEGSRLLLRRLGTSGTGTPNITSLWRGFGRWRSLLWVRDDLAFLDALSRLHVIHEDLVIIA